MKWKSDSTERTEALGRELAAELQAGDILALTGAIGSGKTTFVRGLGEGMGLPAGTVASPSFVLVREYRGGRLPIFHADLYRLEGMPEAVSVGLEEYYDQGGVTVVEWANRIPELLPEDFLEIQFEAPSDTERTLTLVPHGSRATTLCRSVR